MTSLDTIIIVQNPEEIRSLDEVKYLLSRITAYERKRNCRAGVLLIQRRQFDGLYIVIPENEAMEELRKPILDDIPEFGIIYYPCSYFKDLRTTLKERKQPNYSELERKHVITRKNLTPSQ